VDVDPLAAILEPLGGTLDKMIETIGKLLEHVTYLDGRVNELGRQVDELRRETLETEAGSKVRDAALTEQLDGLDDRLTSVHRAALRALNLSTGGAPAA
jgi:hypothetical protein